MSEKRRVRRKLKTSGIKGITDLKVLEINLRRFLLEYRVEETQEPKKTIIALQQGYGIVFPEDLANAVLEFEFEPSGIFSMIRIIKETNSEERKLKRGITIKKYPEDDNNGLPF